MPCPRAHPVPLPTLPAIHPSPVPAEWGGREALLGRGPRTVRGCGQGPLGGRRGPTAEGASHGVHTAAASAQQPPNPSTMARPTSRSWLVSSVSFSPGFLVKFLLTNPVPPERALRVVPVVSWGWEPSPLRTWTGDEKEGAGGSSGALRAQVASQPPSQESLGHPQTPLVQCPSRLVSDPDALPPPTLTWKQQFQARWASPRG